MRIPDAKDLIEGWEPRAPGPAQLRLMRLIGQANGPEGAAMLAQLTQGQANQFFLGLYRSHSTRPLAGLITCPTCQAENEFPVPVEAILALPAPAHDRLVHLDGQAFRLPRLGDLDRASGAADLPSALALACRISGSGPLPDPAPLASAFEAADPAAVLALGLACVGCGQNFEVVVEPARFVAAELDRLTEGLYRQIDSIARAYGWTEAEILGLPPARRLRYAGLTASPMLTAPDGGGMDGGGFG